MSLPLSPIFPGATLPARPGVYRWRFDYTGFPWNYSLWDGTAWHWQAATVAEAAREPGRMSDGRHLFLWRGLSRKP